MANEFSMILEKAKVLGAKVLGSVKAGLVTLGRWSSGRLEAAAGTLSALYSKVSAKLTELAGGKHMAVGTQKMKTKAAPSQRSMPAPAGKHSSFRRRPSVLRAAVSPAGSHRMEKPVRYLRGIEAAELFELAESERRRVQSMAAGETVRESAAPRTGFTGFLYRHRKGLIAACLVFALLAGGVNYLLHLYTREELFITDQMQAGNITIADRLTTTDEQAEKVQYILILGVDDSSLLTDCIWIMCFDNAAHKMNVMQVPRDTYVGSDASWPHKINAVYASPKTVKWCDSCGFSPVEEERLDGVHITCGTELVSRKESNISALIRVINDRLGLPIDHFVIFNFRGFAKIIDTMGGVDIHLDYTVKDAAIHLEPGDHHLTGWPAVDFMRSRKGFSNGDVGRVSNQRILIDALMQKALDMDLATMLDVVITCANAKCFQTDMSLEQIKDIAVAGRQMSVQNLQMVTMPGYDYWPKGGQSYYVCDEGKTAEMINEYLLPYGLPDGSMASADTIDFPNPEGTVRTTADYTPPKTTTGYTPPTTTTTTGGYSEDPTTTTPPPTSVTDPTGGGENTSATTTTTTTAPTTTTTTAAPATTTTTTTAAPTTTTTMPAIIIGGEGEAVGGSVTTPLSDPRA